MFFLNLWQLTMNKNNFKTMFKRKNYLIYMLLFEATVDG